MNQQRPILVIVAVVLAISLGGLGLVTGCLGVFSAAVQSSVIEMQQGLAEGNPALQAQQQALLEAQAAYRIPMALGGLFNFVASLVLIVGAGLLAGLKRSGAMLLLGAAVLCALSDLYNTALATLAVIEATVAQIGQMPGQDPAVLGAAMSAGSTIGVVMALFMLTLKLVVYALCVWAARDAKVQELLR
ncbi:MAG: hypothetical protein ACK6CU_28605 [Deltaproteobacteria bacterium]|jgi:hypothetical protein